MEISYDEQITIIYFHNQISQALNLTASLYMFEVDQENHDLYFVSTDRSSSSGIETYSVIHQLDETSMSISTSKRLKYVTGAWNDTMVIKDKSQIILTAKSPTTWGDYI